MNTPESSPSGNVHGMPLAALLGLGPLPLVELGGPGPKVQAANVALLGIRSVDEAEKRLPELLRALFAEGVVVRDVRVSEPELEEVFVELAR